MKIIISCLILLGFYSSGQAQSLLSFSESRIWKADSIGCLGHRTNIYYSLLARETEFIDISKNQIIEYFGEPNLLTEFVEGDMYYYFIMGGPQCNKDYKEEDLADYDLELMYIFIENGQVTEMGGMKQ